MAKVRLEVVGKYAIAGVTKPGVVELDDERYNIRALERAGHVRRADKADTKKSAGENKSGE